jgi:peptidoglycan/xylan/chitin deacetylase (PgdA/CDA1 family)
LATLGLAAFGVVAGQRANDPVVAVAREKSATPARTPSTYIVARALPVAAASPVAVPIPEAKATPVAMDVPAPTPPVTITPPAAAPLPAGATPLLSSTAALQAPIAVPAAVAPARPARQRLAQNMATPNIAGTATASASPDLGNAHVASVASCDRPGALGVSRVVEIDTTGGPAFGFEHFKQYDFLNDHEVVLTFDDGPWPVNTPAVIKALTDQCAKATFFEIGEHASWHPELSRMVAAAGMTIGSHTWSHKDLAKNPYADDIEQAKQEIEMGVSAVYAAVDAPIAPFFRFPDLQQPPALLTYLGERNIATFSTDVDSFDFKMRRPEQVVASVITKLKKRGKGIVLMHDFQHATGEAMPELLRQLKTNGFKIVHLVPRTPVNTIAKYDDMVRQQDKLSANNTRPANTVFRTISQ